MQDFSDLLHPSTEARRMVLDEMIDQKFADQAEVPAWKEIGKNPHSKFCGCATCQQVFEAALAISVQNHAEGRCFKYLVGLSAALQYIVKVQSSLQIGIGPFPETLMQALEVEAYINKNAGQLTGEVVNLANIRKIVDTHIENARAAEDKKAT